MKVLHICQRDDLATGGAARVAVEFSKALPEYGVDANLVFVYGPPGLFSHELPGRVFHLGLRSSREAARGFSALRRLIVRERVDLVHHHDGLIWTHLATRSLRNLIRIGHAHLSPPPIEARWRMRFAHRVQADAYTHLVAVSESTLGDWISAGFPIAKTTVLPNGVDLKRFRPAAPAERDGVRAQWKFPADAKVVGFVGRLDSAMKGCDEFVDLIAALPESYFGVIAGDGPDQGELRRRARELGVADRLRFLGTVDPAREVYPGLDVFVLTSRYEPFGLVLLEAAASGLPIAMIPGSGGSMDLGRLLGATVLADRSLGPFCAAVQALAVEPTGSNQRACGSDLAEYSWDHAATRLAALYVRLIQTPVCQCIHQ